MASFCCNAPRGEYGLCGSIGRPGRCIVFETRTNRLQNPRISQPRSSRCTYTAPGTRPSQWKLAIRSERSVYTRFHRCFAHAQRRSAMTKYIATDTDVDRNVVRSYRQERCEGIRTHSRRISPSPLSLRPAQTPPRTRHRRAHRKRRAIHAHALDGAVHPDRCLAELPTPVTKEMSMKELGGRAPRQRALRTSRLSPNEGGLALLGRPDRNLPTAP